MYFHISYQDGAQSDHEGADTRRLLAFWKHRTSQITLVNEFYPHQTRSVIVWGARCALNIINIKKAGRRWMHFCFSQQGFSSRVSGSQGCALRACVTSIQVKYKMKTRSVAALCSTNVHPNPWHHNKRLWFITLISHCNIAYSRCMGGGHLSRTVGGCPLQSRWFSSFLKLHNAYETNATTVNS